MAGTRLKREDFIAAIGFQGNIAFVDKKARRRFGKLSAGELIDRGVYRAAFCAALYDSDSAAMDRLLAYYRDRLEGEYETAYDLGRLFGVDRAPEGVAHVKVL